MQPNVTTPHSSRHPRLSVCCLFVSLLSLLAFAITPTDLCAQAALATDPRASTPGSIEGSLRLKDSSKPAPHVGVTIRETGQKVTTDDKGRYSFKDVAPGTYTLVATGEGYGRTVITDVVIRPGGDLSLSRQDIAVRSPNQDPLQLEDFVVSAKKNDGVIELDPYAVEGQQQKPFSTANLDLTRTRDDALPFQTFSAKDIEYSGAAGLSEFLQNRLPQNFNADIANETDGEGVSPNRTDRVDLRGWGVTETVFLLNGRRLPAEYRANLNDNGNATPNLQGIPLGSIERIEVLPSAGSAIYGESATGGVINIITRQDFSGGQLALNYESPTSVHRPSRGATLNYTLPLKGGFSLRIGASYTERHPLHAGDRADVSIARWRQLVMERNPSLLISRLATNPWNTTSTMVTGTTPNIRSGTTAATANLFTNLPGAQGSNFTTIPAGYTGGGLAAFQPGVWNLGLAEGAAGSLLVAKDSTLGTLDKNTVLSLGVDKRLCKRWNWSLDARRVEYRSEGQFAGLVTLGDARTLVPAAAPTNPFGQNVLVKLVDPQLHQDDLVNRSENITWELSSTLRGELGDWRGFIDLSYSRNENFYPSNGLIEPVGTWRNALLTGAYNPFVDSRVARHAAPEFYDNFIIQRNYFAGATENYQTALKASGPVVHLPAGAVQLTGGVEWAHVDRTRAENFGQYRHRRTGAPLIPEGATSSFPVVAFSPGSVFTFDTYSAYAETTAPLVAPEGNIPLLKRLEVFGSGRLDHTRRDGFRLDGQPIEFARTTRLRALGLRYDLADGVAFRVSQSIGFRPPTMSQVAPANPPTATSTGLTDPRRNEAVVLTPAMYVTGGNPDLKAETTDSMNYGIIFSPRWIPGFRMTIDYLESTREDAIFSLAAQEAINLEGELPIVRRGPADGHSSGVGPIVFVDRRFINLREVASRSMDFFVEQDFPRVFGGRLVATLSASRNLSFKVQTTNTGASIEQVRNRDGAFARQIAWNASSHVQWDGRQWGFGWSARYYDYILASAADFQLQGSDRAPWKVNHDINVTYRVPSEGDAKGLRWLYSDLSVTFGVKNIFDREPRFWANSFDRGIAPYDSIMGRSVWIQVRKQL